jgi:hypothetical protein
MEYVLLYTITRITIPDISHCVWAISALRLSVEQDQSFALLVEWFDLS